MPEDASILRQLYRKCGGRQASEMWRLQHPNINGQHTAWKILPAYARAHQNRAGLRSRIWITYWGASIRNARESWSLNREKCTCKYWICKATTPKGWNTTFLFQVLQMAWERQKVPFQKVVTYYVTFLCQLNDLFQFSASMSLLRSIPEWLQALTGLLSP